MSQHIDLSIYHPIDKVDRLVQAVQWLATQLNYQIEDAEDLVEHISVFTRDESTVSVSFWSAKQDWIAGFTMIQREINWEVDIAYCEEGWNEVDQIHYLYRCLRSIKQTGGVGSC